MEGQVSALCGPADGVALAADPMQPRALWTQLQPPFAVLFHQCCWPRDLGGVTPVGVPGNGPANRGPDRDQLQSCSPGVSSAQGPRRNHGCPSPGNRPTAGTSAQTRPQPRTPAAPQPHAPGTTQERPGREAWKGVFSSRCAHTDRRPQRSQRIRPIQRHQSTDKLQQLTLKERRFRNHLTVNPE